MKKPTQRATVLAIAIAALATVAGAQAQTTSTNNSTNAYAMTGVPKIYFDLSAGQTDYRLGNGSGLFGSNNGSTAYAISAGSYFTNNVGVELGYTDFGRINRGGGETRADGVTLKLVGKLPLGPQFNLLGKVGTTYGRTEVTSAAGSGITAGSDNGFGVNLGIGAEFLFTPNWSAVVQYDAHDLRFVSSSNDRDRIGIATVGIRYTY